MTDTVHQFINYYQLLIWLYMSQLEDNFEQNI